MYKKIPLRTDILPAKEVINEIFPEIFSRNTEDPFFAALTRGTEPTADAIVYSNLDVEGAGTGL